MRTYIALLSVRKGDIIGRQPSGSSLRPPQFHGCFKEAQTAGVPSNSFTFPTYVSFLRFVSSIILRYGTPRGFFGMMYSSS